MQIGGKIRFSRARAGGSPERRGSNWNDDRGEVGPSYIPEYVED